MSTDMPTLYDVTVRGPQGLIESSCGSDKDYALSSAKAQDNKYVVKVMKLTPPDYTVRPESYIYISLPLTNGKRYAKEFDGKSWVKLED